MQNEKAPLTLLFLKKIKTENLRELPFSLQQE